jgi:signal transduction histidine kinase
MVSKSELAMAIEHQEDVLSAPPERNSGSTSTGIGGTAARWTALVVMLVVLSVAHFVTPAQHSWLHDFLFKLTYLPIILAGLWFGWRGGFFLALLTGLVYVVHIRLQLSGHHVHGVTGFLLELVLYLLIGLVVGLLSDRQRKIQDRLSAAHSDLQRSFAALREKTEALLEAEESLRRADRLKAAGEIASGLAHEVRNPLGGIVGAAEILAKPATDDQARAEFAAVLTRETKRLDRVITQFLDFARPGSSNEGTSNLREELEFVEKLTAGPRGKKRTVFSAEAVSGDLNVAISADALRQVLLNLTLNALSAVPSDTGRIEWSAVGDGMHVHLRIEDNGPGIDERVFDRLFEPFVTSRDGTGLGLAIVARLVDDVGGSVTVERTDSSGTVFRLTFPVAEPSGQSGETQ